MVCIEYPGGMDCSTVVAVVAVEAEYRGDDGADEGGEVDGVIVVPEGNQPTTEWLLGVDADG